MAYRSSVSAEFILELIKLDILRGESVDPLPSTNRRLVEARLRYAVHGDAGLMRKISQPYHEELNRAYYLASPRHLPRPFGLIAATVGIEPVVAALGMLISQRFFGFKIPMPAATVRVRNGTEEVRIYGGDPLPGHRYALLDDICRQGETIIKALNFWLARGYDIDRVIVFTDSGEGGLKRIEEEVGRVQKDRGNSIEVTCLVSPEDILYVIDATK